MMIIDKDFLKDIFGQIRSIWNFNIITLDQNPITIGTLIFGITLFLIGLWLSRRLSRRLTTKWLSKWVHEENSLHSLQTLIFYFFLIFFSLFALKIAHIPLTIFTVIGGALAIGVGFGSQNLVNNFISGVILMIEKPIKVGDAIEVDGIFGEVEDIGTRCTKILVGGNRHLIVPNSVFLEKNFVNWTHRNRLVRGSVKIGIAYGSSLPKVEEILKNCVLALNDPFASENPAVSFLDFGDNALNIEVAFWVRMNALGAKSSLESKLRFLIYEALEKEGISIPYPQRDMRLSTENPLKVKIES